MRQPWQSETRKAVFAESLGKFKTKAFCILLRAAVFLFLGSLTFQKCHFLFPQPGWGPEIKADVFSGWWAMLCRHMAGGPCEKDSGTVPPSTTLHSPRIPRSVWKTRDSSLRELYGCLLCDMRVCMWVHVHMCVSMWVSLCEIDKYTIFTVYMWHIACF